MARTRRDPKLDELAESLPADGSSIVYDAWISQLRAAGRFDLVRLVHQVRRDGAAVFEISLDSAGNVVHSVKRAPVTA